MKVRLVPFSTPEQAWNTHDTIIADHADLDRISFFERDHHRRYTVLQEVRLRSFSVEQTLVLR